MALSEQDKDVIKTLVAELRTSQPVARNSLSLGKVNKLPGVLQASMVGLSVLLLVVVTILGYRQVSKPDVAKAAAATPYTETWAATEMFYTESTSLGPCAVAYGFPASKTLVYAALASPGYVCTISVSTGGSYGLSPFVTKWSVTGTVGP